MKTITLDCETLRTAAEIQATHNLNSGFDRPDLMGLACLMLGTEAEAYDGRQARKLPRLDYTLVFPIDNEIDEQERLWSMYDAHSVEYAQEVIDSYDRIISFNGEAFDFKVLEGVGFDTSGWKEKSFDIAARFSEAAGHRISLSNLAKSLLKEEKSLEGTQAVDYWNGGLALLRAEQRERGWKDENIYRAEQYLSSAVHLFDTVIDYCKSDVAITKRIYDVLVEQNGTIQYYNSKTKGRPKVTLRMD